MSRKERFPQVLLVYDNKKGVKTIFLFHCVSETLLYILLRTLTDRDLYIRGPPRLSFTGFESQVTGFVTRVRLGR